MIAPLTHLSLLLVSQAVSAWAGPASQLKSTSVDASETCITRYRYGQPLQSIPTSTRTFHRTVKKTMVEEPEQRTITLTITASSYPPAPTVSPSDQETTTVWVTKTPAAPMCSSTSTVTPSATTVYTGTYEAPTYTPESTTSQSRRTDLRLKLNTNLLMHFAGHTPFQSHLKNPRRVNCLRRETTYLVSTTTCSPKTVTQIHTTSSPPTTSPSFKTFTLTTTLPPSSPTPCTLTLPTPTTTLHKKCSPQNLISSTPLSSSNKTLVGIAGTRPGPSIIDEGLFPGGNPSACCQMCMDTSGEDGEMCAGMADDVWAGNCFLFYVSAAAGEEKGDGGTCGVAFDYVGDASIAPGEGFVVQSGCGSLQAIENDA